MVQFFPDSVLIPALVKLVGANLYYWLYINNYAPVYGTTIADFTPTAVTDMTLQTASAGSFTLQSVSGHLGRVTATDLTFTAIFAVPVTYGYFATTANAAGLPAGDLVVAAMFDTPVTFGVGDTLNITPTLALKMAV